VLNTYKKRPGQKQWSNQTSKNLRHAPMTGHDLIYFPPFKWP